MRTTRNDLILMNPGRLAIFICLFFVFVFLFGFFFFFWCPLLNATSAPCNRTSIYVRIAEKMSRVRSTDFPSNLRSTWTVTPWTVALC